VNATETTKDSIDANESEMVVDPNTPTVKRIEMKPDAQSIWNDICLLNEESNINMTESEALDVESKLLVCTGGYRIRLPGFLLITSFFPAKATK
jgi:hypothetical protein